jgi:uncharacterized damage-inducible protein DinB
MPDALLTSARDLLRRARDDVRAAIDGLPPDALNWRPAGPDTNSIAVLATHSLTSTREWLSVAVGEPPPERDRDSEFEATARDSGEFLAFVDGMFDECLDLVDEGRSVDWGALPKHWDPGRDIELLPAWALLHALGHLREHVGQMSLTRQLWEARAAGLD